MLRMLPSALWAAALVPVMSLAAPSPAPAAAAPRFEPGGVWFAQSPVNLPEATFHGMYGSAADATYVYRVAGDGVKPWAVGRGMHLVWIGLAGVEGLADDIVAQAFRELEHGSMTAKIEAYVASFNVSSPADAYAAGDAPGQQPLAADVDRPEAGSLSLDVLTFLSGPGDRRTSAMVYVSDAMLPVLDMFLPSFLVPVVVPHKPYPAAPSIGGSLQEAVPEERVKHLEKLTKHIKFSPEVDNIVQSLSVKQLEKDIAYLTGEDSSSPILSRHSFSSGAILAANFLKAEVEATGANCTLEPFLTGFAPNVICHYPILGGQEEEEDIKRVIISGHYDSRGSFGSTRAPGGDDDASGSGSVLAIAKAIKAAGIKGFKHQATVAFFAGEEQGLLGSHAYAQKLYEANSTVLIQVQSDMLAYHEEGETLQLGFPDLIGAPAAADLLRKLAAIYSPELVIGITPACCSDHQSFNALGFPATQVFERNGGIIDPMYHNSGDLSWRAGYDLDQVISIGKVTFATLLEVAEYVI